jgi:cytochrome c oxidase subunit 2
MNDTKPSRAIPERVARWLLAVAILSIPLALLGARWITGNQFGERVVEIHAKMPQRGGWSPTDITIEAGKPLHLRLISDDVVHGFAIGQSDQPAIDMLPGKTVETTLTFDQPGKYTYYCTRWCGLNHWRMRGTIDVTSSSGSSSHQIGAEKATQPLFVTLGMDIDAPHPADHLPSSRPSAKRGASLDEKLPEQYSDDQYYLTHSPAETWLDLQQDLNQQGLSDQQIWDLVALIWQKNTAEDRLASGSELYAENCAACHGENGKGSGVMAKPVETHNQEFNGHSIVSPPDFTDSNHMLGASPALLEGKIIRGGMGTGMPYWGPIFTSEQVRSLVDYLWTFQFETEVKP